MKEIAALVVRLFYLSSTQKESCYQVKWQPSFEEAQWRVTGKPMFTKLHRGQVDFSPPVSYIWRGNHAWNGVTPDHTHHHVVRTSDYSNPWKLDPREYQAVFAGFIVLNIWQAPGGLTSCLNLQSPLKDVYAGTFYKCLVPDMGKRYMHT